MKRTTIAAVSLVALVFVAPLRWAQPHDDKERAELAQALKDGKISLQQGVTASGKEGKPISAKYEVEDGKLQLSVYTMKGDAFSEVIVDHKTGKISKSEPITGGDDLTAAKKQAEAMGKAKHTLADVIAGAEKSHPGFHAVSIMPEIEDGAAQADVTLLKGSTSKQIEQPL